MPLSRKARKLFDAMVQAIDEDGTLTVFDEPALLALAGVNRQNMTKALNELVEEGLAQKWRLPITGTQGPGELVAMVKHPRGCEGCGRPSTSGRYCPRCKQVLRADRHSPSPRALEAHRKAEAERAAHWSGVPILVDGAGLPLDSGGFHVRLIRLHSSSSPKKKDKRIDESG